MKKTKTDAGSWCAVCHHMIQRTDSAWGHASDDDWAGPGDCACAITCRSCLPEGKNAARNYFAQETVAVRGVTEAFWHFSETLTEAGAAVLALYTAYTAEEQA
jgi:hypothetical protein